MLTLYTSHPTGLKIGNGKTVFLTEFLFKEYLLNHRDIRSNYELGFEFEYALDIDEFFELDNLALGIDEFPAYLSLYDNMTGGDKKKKKFFLLPREARKKHLDITITAQNIMDVHASWRRMIDRAFMVIKYHPDGNVCKNDRCDYPHYYIAYDTDSTYKKIINVEKANYIYDLYDSDKIIMPDDLKESLINENKNWYELGLPN